MPENLNSRVFAEQLNTPFRIGVAGREPLVLELFEVTEGHDSPRLEQFSLMFRGPMTFMIGQGLYRMNHDKLGELDLFLVPIGPDQKGLRYQVIFNRIRRSPAPPDQSVT